MESILKDTDLSNIVYMYFDLQLSTTDIAKEYNCSDQTVGRFLSKNGYKLRNKKESLRTKNVKEKISQNTSDNWKNKEFRENQVDKRKGKSSGALGKTWKIKNRDNYPSIKGDKNPNWKNGKTKLSFAIKNTQEYKIWRKSVFERDNYTCQCCNRRNKSGNKVILECHHIKPFSIILSEYNIKTVDEALCCEELFDINNGQTLCKECHKKTESYGVNVQYAI